jgi:hypothetical protein
LPSLMHDHLCVESLKKLFSAHFTKFNFLANNFKLMKMNLLVCGDDREKV